MVDNFEADTLYCNTRSQPEEPEKWKNASLGYALPNSTCTTVIGGAKLRVFGTLQ